MGEEEDDQEMEMKGEKGMIILIRGEIIVKKKELKHK